MSGAEEKWQSVIRDWEGSEKSQIEYCREKEINLKTFTTWKSKLKKRSVKSKVKWIGVERRASLVEMIEMEIETLGLTVKIPIDAGIETMRDVLLAVKQTCTI